jgi:hypothetical protein
VTGEWRYTGVESRGEQQPLPIRGRHVEQASYRGQEAQVRHMVGLVEDRDLNAIQSHMALLDEVLEATGGRDEHVDTVPKRTDLRVLADAADDDRRAHRHGLGQGRKRRIHLKSKLAGRNEDERTGATGLAPLAGRGQTGDRRHAEGDGLAAAGAAAAQHVTSSEGIGQRGCLDGEGLGDAASRQ